MTATVAHQDVHASLSGVTRIYPAAAGTQAVHALGPVDLDLKRGEFFAVVGPSGCGKSTLLEVLAGLQQPTAGTVTFEGRSVTGEVPDGIGVVFQEDASFPWLSVFDNIAFGLREMGKSVDDVRASVDYALAVWGRRDPDLWGSIERQIGRGFGRNPYSNEGVQYGLRALMSGEILPEQFVDLNDKIGGRRIGATILLITHALDEAAMLSDRIGAMSARPGRFLDIVATGWPRERDSTIVSEAAFGEITGRLWDNLRGESMKSLGYSGMAAE